MGEEIEVIRQMPATGNTGWWTPESRVQHWVPRRSQTLDYVRRWIVGCWKYMALSPEQGAEALHKRPHLLYARILRHEVSFRLRRHFAPPEVSIQTLTRSSLAQGQLLASRSTRREARS